MTAFAAAMDVIFTDPNISAAATYVTGNQVREVRVVLARPDVIQDFGSARVHKESLLIEVRVAEVSHPSRGDQFFIGGSEYRVQGVPIRDRERLVWQIEAVPA
jgi:hypothetical protein